MTPPRVRAEFGGISASAFTRRAVAGAASFALLALTAGCLGKPRPIRGPSAHDPPALFEPFAIRAVMVEVARRQLLSGLERGGDPVLGCVRRRGAEQPRSCGNFSDTHSDTCERRQGVGERPAHRAFRGQLGCLTEQQRGRCMVLRQL